METMFTHITHEKPLPKIERVTIDGKRYYKTPEGNILLPSVTTVLSNADKDKTAALVNWKKRVGEVEANKIKNNSATRGTGLHKACDLFLQNIPVSEIKIMPNAKEFFNTLKPELNKINNIHYQEAGMYSVKLGLAGTVDLIGEYKGVLSVIDYKNAKALRTEKMIWSYFLQAAAYGLMYNEWLGYPAVKQIVILMAVENEITPQVFIKKPGDYIEELLRVVANYIKTEHNK